MDLTEALYASMLAIVTADSGAGGMANSASDAYIVVDASATRFIFIDNPNYSLDRIPYSPCVLVSIENRAMPRWGTTASTTRQLGVSIVRMHVIHRRSEPRTKHDALCYRIRTRFDGVALASQTGWTFSPGVLDRDVPLQPTTEFIRQEMVFIVAAGAAAAPVNGIQASATFAGAEGAAVPATLFGRGTDENFQPEVRDITRRGDRARRRAIALNDAIITLRFAHSSMALVPPTGTYAVLVVYSDTAGGHGITYDAIVIGWRHATRADGGDSQDLIITFGLTIDPLKGAGTSPVSSA